jgi:hypothetical protein
MGNRAGKLGKAVSPSSRPVKRTRAAAQQVINFAVIGDSHVGYGNSSALFKNVLQKAAGTGNKRFVIFGGDNAHAGADHGQFAQARYRDFKQIADGMLNPKHIRYKASIGNWETTTRSLFRSALGNVTGQLSFPGTGGRVKYIWLDNASGQFSTASINLLNSLNASSYYIIDFHWPLNIKGFSADPGHVLTPAETKRFFDAIPAAARDKVLAIFTHHAHKFYHKYANIYPGFAKTKFFVTGCSGAYRCTPGGRGYYEASLTLQNNQYTVSASQVKV